MIRIGIVGLGFMGRTHYEAYQKLPDAKVVMVADNDPRRAAGDLTGGWGNLNTGAITQLPMDQIRGVTDFADLIADKEVDVVDICVPTPRHVDLALAALAAGKHVLCEKPLALSSADARRVAAAAASARGIFMPAMCVRFWPQWHWLKLAVDSGEYGPVRSATFRRLGAMPAGWFREGELSGGAIFDLHVHDTDFIYCLFGKPTSVFSRGYSKTSGKTDHLLTHYFFAPGGPMVAAEGGWCMADAFPFAMRYTVNFEHATADYDSGRADAPLILYRGGHAQVITAPGGDGYLGEIGYFLECVKTGSRPSRVTADDAVASLSIVEAEQRSIDTGIPQQL